MWAGTENQIEIELFLIRHGATASNGRGCYLGRTDEVLSAHGRAVIQESYEGFAGRHGFAADRGLVFTGPMKRCRQTAELIFPEADNKIVIPEWTEMDFGDFEGKTYRELSGNPDYQAWIDSGGQLAFPNGEARSAFIERSMRGFQKMAEICKGSALRRNLCQKKESQPQEGGNRYQIKAAVILHGGNIMAILSQLCEGDYYDYQVKPGEGYRVFVQAGEQQWRVIEIDDLSEKRMSKA